MSASDIPTLRWESSDKMARVLVTYMSDAAAIRLRIREEFQSSPTERSIRILRSLYLASREKAPVESHKPHEGYYPTEVADLAAQISKRFLASLTEERRLSDVRALQSPILTDPRLTDEAWDAAIDGFKEAAE